MEPKKTRGRQRIEIKRLEGNRQVTFTKRRKGLFNKASELCVATNAEVAILAQSVGGGRVFAFGHPNVDYVVDAYLGNNVVDAGGVSEDLSPMYEDSNKKYLEILEETEAEKTKVSNVEGCTRGLWWKNSVEDLEIDELEIFVDSMEKLKINLMKKADELRSSGTSSSFDEIANASVADGSVDDQVVLPNLDQFLQYNVGLANENLMMPAVNYDSSGVNNYGFGNEGLVLDNHVNEHLDGGDNLQDQSDFGSFGVPDPNDLYFSQD